MSKYKPTLPEAFSIYFWDCDPATLDLTVHKRFIAERILVYGNGSALRWLYPYLNGDEWRKILSSGRNLDAKTRNYWLKRFERIDQNR